MVNISEASNVGERAVKAKVRAPVEALRLPPSASPLLWSPRLVEDDLVVTVAGPPRGTGALRDWMSRAQPTHASVIPGTGLGIMSWSGVPEPWLPLLEAIQVVFGQGWQHEMRLDVRGPLAAIEGLVRRPTWTRSVIESVQPQAPVPETSSLTRPQEDLLLAGAARGLFDAPRGTTVRKLAAHRQASAASTSELLRRAHASLLADHVARTLRAAHTSAAWEG